MFTSEDFRKIILSAKTRMGNYNRQSVYNRIMHMSELRTNPLWQYKNEDIVETVKRCAKVLEHKYSQYKKS